VSLELPPASSIRAARPGSGAAPRKGRGPRGRRLRIGLLSLLAVSCAAALAASIGVAAGTLSRPRIESLEPSLGEPGGEVALRGRNFGAVRGEGRVDVDGMVPTAGSYVSWADSEIRLRLPASFDSGLLRVVTRSGRSNPKLFMNRARLPVLVSGERDGGGGPRIASISPEEGTIGSLLVVSGSGFGDGRGDSELRFARAGDAEGSTLQADGSPPLSIAPAAVDLGYELWSDKEIRLRVPDGAVSGPVYVVGGKSRSNAAFFRVFSASGAKRYSSRARYSLAQGVSVKKIKVSGPAELYLWAPLPAESASQLLVGILGQEPPPMVGDYRGTALYRLSGLQSGKDREMSQSFLVEVYAVEAAINPDLGPIRPQDPPALMAAYAAPDALVPSSSPVVQDLAKRILRGERGSWRAARLVWDWLGQNLRWTDRHEHEKILDALKDKSADSYSYAVISAALLRAAGLPTLPVAGYLVDPSRRAVRHYWNEVFVYGLGWVPLDPVLGSGASPGGIRPAWEDRARYFGGLDNRHIAFSRGLSVLAPLSPSGKRASKERRWSFQSFYEEASGALDAYSSFWGDVEVTGAY
jgi:transglutaminase-like putative cysteine protease